MNESDSDEGSQPGRHQEQSSPSPINANGSRLSVLASQQNSRTSSSNSLSPNRRVSPREFDRLEWIQNTARELSRSSTDEELWVDLMRFANGRGSSENSPGDIADMLGKMFTSSPPQELIKVEPRPEKNSRSNPGTFADLGTDSDNSSLYPEEDDRSVSELIKEYTTTEEHDLLTSLLFSTFSQIERLSKAFARPDDTCPNLSLIRESHRHIYSCPTFVASTISMGAGTLLDHVRLGLQSLTRQQMGAFIVLFEFSTHMDIEYNNHVLPKLFETMSSWKQETEIEFETMMEECLERHCAILPAEARPAVVVALFRNYVTTIHHFIMCQLMKMDSDAEINPSMEETVQYATHVLGIFYAMNERLHLVPYIEFYNELINEHLQIKEDYPKWKTQEGFSFCNYPFILNTTTKSDILKVESMIQMRHELQNAFFRALFIGVNSPYLILEVRRDHLIRDTLFQLQGKTAIDVKKQLRVSFVGEDGIDEGGVQKEFFQLVIKEMFEPMYGMFSENFTTRAVWFSNALADDGMIEEYNLIGRLISLAIYNGVILDLQFPMALYKKLCDRKVGMDDLADLDEDLSRGLKSLLSHEGDVGDFERFFEIEVESTTGEKTVVELCENGSTLKVSNGNRKDFVDLYIDYILNLSCNVAFSAFKDGYDSVMAGTAISLFRAEELSELILGSNSLDFDELRKVAQYDGFTAESQTVLFFWQVMEELSDEEKKKLLFFATGSDRVPIGGFSKLGFVLAKNGDDPTRLPTSHTCYNVLMLSEYPTKDTLKERLLTALKFSDCGFYLN